MGKETITQDPIVPDWQSMHLADTWPDGLRLLSFSGIRELFASVFGNRAPVELPADMPGKNSLPRYLLQEFHNVPNGNYSNRFSRGYITGFERSMLGKLDNARAWLAQRLQDCQAVLDVGTAGGKTARAIYDAGVKQVWGVDPSPYLLKHAASDHQEIAFIQGVAEDLPFPCARFDGISVCFVFHEIPPKYIKEALKEFHRVLKAGGKVTISEPSKAQLQPIRLLDFITLSGWQRLYFKSLARFVYEPFLESWHNQDKQALFAECGFELAEYQAGMPINLYLLKKREIPADFV